MTKIQIEEPDGFVKPVGYYVYIHFRKSNARPFYVGVGQNDRYRQTKRTDWWVNCARKRGVYVEIVQCFDDRDDAYLLETWLIAKMRHEGENLVNITNGGAGKSRGPKKRKVDYGTRYNSVTVYCSNGKVFESASLAAKWCTFNGYKTASGAKITTVCDIAGRTAYGHSWSRIGRPTVPEFTGRAATNNGISQKKSKIVFCSNGMSFSSCINAANWCVREGHEKASQCVISSCATGRLLSAYGHAWSYTGFPDIPEATGSDAKKLSSRHLKIPVVCVETGEVFESASYAGRLIATNGKGQSNIWCCLKGKTKTAYGYTWRFYDAENI